MSNLPDLDALRRNESAAWDQLFLWLSPEARKSVRLELIGFPEAEIEDVAGEAIYLIVEKVKDVCTTQELLPLVKKIAKDKAIDHLRKNKTLKSGSGKVGSLDELREKDGDKHDPPSPDRPDEQAQRTERKNALLRGLDRIKPLFRALLVDFYLVGKSYEELARDYRLALGTVGVYLKRALEAVRDAIEGNSGLTDALKTLVAALAHFVVTLACLP